MAKKSKIFTPEKIEKNIRRTGEYSYEVRIMKAGHLIEKTFDDLTSARNYRDGINHKSALDPIESNVFESRIKKRAVAHFTFKNALECCRSSKIDHVIGFMRV